MLSPQYTTKFEKDLKRMMKRGKKAKKLKDIIKLLLQEKPLPQKYREHQLVGNYKGRHECHIEPDWILIYKTLSKEILFERTGSHSDLFR